MSEARRLLPPGQMLLGRFRVGEPLGAGGMGTVYRAEHVALEMPVAIKVIAGDPTSEKWGTLEARFEREARTLARMRSEFVSRVLDFGKLDSGEPFLVLEFLDGKPLTVVADHERLSLEERVDFLAQGIAGVAEAHRLGLVHRDLKPSNLFIASVQGERRQTKVIDFGVVRAADGAVVTRGDSLLGTPEFMSPEQVLSAHDVDARTDVWSLGATLFWLLSGELPFDGASRLQLLASIAKDPPRAWLLEGRGVPAGLVETVLACLAKEPGDRPATVAALGARLGAWAGPEGKCAIDLALETLEFVESSAPSTLRAEPLDLEGAGGAPATMSLDYWKSDTPPAGDESIEQPSTRARAEPSRSSHAREFSVPDAARRRR